MVYFTLCSFSCYLLPNLLWIFYVIQNVKIIQPPLKKISPSKHKSCGKESVRDDLENEVVLDISEGSAQ